MHDTEVEVSHNYALLEDASVVPQSCRQSACMSYGRFFVFLHQGT
jgi:hypothetical protein